MSILASISRKCRSLLKRFIIAKISAIELRLKVVLHTPEKFLGSIFILNLQLSKGSRITDADINILYAICEAQGLHTELWNGLWLGSKAPVTWSQGKSFSYG